jgi:hypothetical protein
LPRQAFHPISSYYSRRKPSLTGAYAFGFRAD